MNYQMLEADLNICGTLLMQFQLDSLQDKKAKLLEITLKQSEKK